MLGVNCAASAFQAEPTKIRDVCLSGLAELKESSEKVIH